MSQVAHPRISVPTQLRSKRAVWLAALIALAIGASALIVALGDNESATTNVSGAQALPQRGPDESAVAASVSRAATPVAGPNEAGTAAAVGGSSALNPSGPDESRTAVSISGR